MANATRELFTTVRAEQDQHLRFDDPNERARARARLLQAIDREAKPGVGKSAIVGGRRWGWGLGAGLATCAVAILVIGVVGLPGSQQSEQLAEGLDPAPSRALQFRMDGVEFDAKHVITTATEPELIAVSDSTRIELAPRSQMFVDGIRSNGASVVLDHGEIALAVHHEDDTSWQVAAGPWTVHVTGTQFVVAWEPTSEQLRVAVTEGSVRVEGPANEVVQLRAGDELVRPNPALASATEFDLVPGGIEAIDSIMPIDPIEATDPVNPTAGSNTSKPSKSTARKWIRHFDDADYQAAWEALADQPGGIHAEAERVTDAKTVLDLADVARFTKHASDTRKLLQRLRDRFPSTTEAGDAAFALGRLAADGGSQAQAAAWFERYLDERPNGSFAGDALGRLIDCYAALGETDEAKSAAKRYLASHAKGPHASKAEKILAR